MHKPWRHSFSLTWRRPSTLSTTSFYREAQTESLGLSSNNLEWFHSYLFLSYPIQKTVIGQASSTSRKVSVSVPQGSILGPLLFAIYINDLPKVLRNTTVTLFADDTALYCSSQSARDLQTMLNQDLDRLAQWLYEHKLTLNVSNLTP